MTHSATDAVHIAIQTWFAVLVDSNGILQSRQQCCTDLPESSVVAYSLSSGGMSLMLATSRLLARFIQPLHIKQLDYLTCSIQSPELTCIILHKLCYSVIMDVSEAISLAQIVDAFAGYMPPSRQTFNLDRIEGLRLLAADTFNVCRNGVVPGRVASQDHYDQLLAVIDRTPVAALKSGIGEMPRLRSELGGFLGFAPHVSPSGWHDDFQPAAGTAMGIGSVGVSLRMGLDGVMSEASDGLAFVEFGVSNDSPSFDSFLSNQVPTTGDNDLSTMPARSSISARMRMPFFRVPGDLPLGALFIAPFSLKNVNANGSHGEQWWTISVADRRRFSNRSVSVHTGSRARNPVVWICWRQTVDFCSSTQRWERHHLGTDRRAFNDD
jgi:hypothetical protein